MASFESMPHFTNQLAYQSVFSPPGFSFESPFGYPSTHGAPGQSSSSSSMPSTHAHGHEQGRAAPLERSTMHPGQDDGMPTWSAQTDHQRQSQQEQQKKGSQSLQYVSPPVPVRYPTRASSTSMSQLTYFSDFFAAPPVRLNTGDRFSQLLDQKLGLDQQLTSSAFMSASAPLQPQQQQQQQQQQAAHNFDNSASSYQYPPSSAYMAPAPSSSYPPQTWDQLAIESNLQDYSQVQIQPDLVAPLPPPQYFQYEAYMAGMSLPIASGSGSGSNLASAPQQQQQEQQQQQTMSPYPPYADSFPSMSAPLLPVQSSPASLSSRSSPSMHPAQLGTPQMNSDLRWPTPYPTGTPPVPLPRHAQSQPILRHPSADTTTYQPFQRVRLHQDISSSMAAGPSTGSPLGGPPHTVMPPAPAPALTAHSQSYPGPAGNGSWARDMVATSSSSSAPPTQPMPLPMPMAPQQQSSGPGNMAHNLQPNMFSSQPLSRSSSQNTWSTEYISTHIPSTFPPAPALSKRSRSPHSQQSSHSLSDPEELHDIPRDAQHAQGQALKRPKLSLPMSLPASYTHGDDDSDKKPVIACHTCRARKLKCDGARPKCHHCSRRNEDACVYDAVLRRRGPGKKNKSSKQKGDQRSVSPASANLPHDPNASGSGSAALGSRFEMSTERS